MMPVPVGDVTTMVPLEAEQLGCVRFACGARGVVFTVTVTDFVLLHWGVVFDVAVIQYLPLPKVCAAVLVIWVPGLLLLSI